jgi:hypothetical protein
VGVKLFHAEGQTIRYDETNITFSLFCERADVTTYCKATGCFMHVKLVLYLVMYVLFISHVHIIAKMNISFLLPVRMSVRLSVCPNGTTRLLLKGFS